MLFLPISYAVSQSGFIFGVSLDFRPLPHSADCVFTRFFRLLFFSPSLSILDYFSVSHIIFWASRLHPVLLTWCYSFWSFSFLFFCKNLLPEVILLTKKFERHIVPKWRTNELTSRLFIPHFPDQNSIWHLIRWKILFVIGVWKDKIRIFSIFAILIFRLPNARAYFVYCFGKMLRKGT